MVPESDLLWLLAAAGLLLLGGGLATVAAGRRAPPPPAEPPFEPGAKGRALRAGRDRAIVAGIRLAVQMARVDGEVHAAEMNAIHDFLTTHVKRRDVPWAARMMRAALEDPPDDDAVGRAVAELAGMDAERRALVIRLLAWVARADARIHEAERAFLVRVGLAIGLTGEELERLISLDEAPPAPEHA